MHTLLAAAFSVTEAEPLGVPPAFLTVARAKSRTAAQNRQNVSGFSECSKTTSFSSVSRTEANNQMQARDTASRF